MSTFLFKDHVFGPVKSRRLGMSLGINLLSLEYKVCNFDCIYCECGFTSKDRFDSKKFVDEEKLFETLNERLTDLKNQRIDAITLAGNGEPTLHPAFGRIMQHLHEWRVQHFPDAQLVLLTNGTTLNKAGVRSSLKYFDQTVVKLDAGDEESIKLIDQPLGKYDLDKLIRNLIDLRHKITVQTMFLAGEVDGVWFDNSSDAAVEKWLSRLALIQPEQVMIYSIDRDTPTQHLRKIEKKKLLQIAEKVKALGIQTQVV